MRQTLGSGGTHAYVAAMAGLWLDVRRTLTELDVLAAEPALLDEDDALPALQYELHCAGEVFAGLTPPDGAHHLHDELAEALADARDATAEVCEAHLAGGVDAVTPLVWEWRGALFRVRYARLRLQPARPLAPAAPRLAQPSPRTPPAVTAGVIALGSALVLTAALLGLWLLVALMLAGTAAASFYVRP